MEYRDRDLIITVNCGECCREFSVIVDEKDYQGWKSGKENITEVMDYLHKSERELLISQTCDDCWKFLYGEG